MVLPPMLCSLFSCLYIIYSVQFASVRFGWWSLVQSGSLRSSPVHFGLVWFDPVRFGLVRFGSVGFSDQDKVQFVSV